MHRDGFTVAQLNVMDFSTSSNAIIQDNSEGLMRKNTKFTSRERTAGVETEKKNNCLIPWFDGDMIGDVDSNPSPQGKYQ